MADISLISSDKMDETKDGLLPWDSKVTILDQLDGDPKNITTHVHKVIKCALSYDFSERKKVPGMVSATLRAFPAAELIKNLPELMKYVIKVGDESMLKHDVFEEILNMIHTIGDLAYRNKINGLKEKFAECLLPFIARNLGCEETMLTYTALMDLIWEEFTTKQQLEIQVCPSILSITKNCDDERVVTKTITIMSRMARYMGRDVVERVFMQRFSELCTSDKFGVRKICASTFGEFCPFVSKESFENLMLPAYIKLCEDPIWGVRKSCAEVIMLISGLCTPEKRRSTLPPVFVKLLEDDNRWVKMSAFRNLGPFITTFAKPSVTKLIYSGGNLVLANRDGQAFLLSKDSISTCLRGNEDENDPVDADLFFPFGKPESQKKCLVELYSSTQLHQYNFGDVEDNEEEDDVLKSPIYPDNAEKEKQICNDETKTSLEEERLLPPFSNHLNGDCKDEKENNNETKLEINEDEAISELNLSDVWPSPPPDEPFDNLNILISNNSLNNGGDGPPPLPPTEDENKPVAIENETSSRPNETTLTAATESRTNLDSDKSEGTNNELLETTSSTNCIVNNICEDVADGDSKGDGNAENNGKQVILNIESDKEDDNLHLYNSYYYWYISPDLPLDPSIVNGGESPDIQTGVRNYAIRLQDLLASIRSSDDDFTEENSVLNSDIETKAVITPIKEPDQDIVPQKLIDHFVSMTDPSLSLNIDVDMTYNCAYSLPAVALTLGGSNWHLLKPIADALASDLQYKVRRIVASSLHELAVILGPEKTTTTLLPLFDGFLKDLDEVKIGVLEHLTKFLKFISPCHRMLCLHKLSKFLQTDNESNWRFREELGKQLLLAVVLFKPADVSKHIGNIAQDLLCDKVAAVRQVALLLVTEIVRHISCEHSLTSHMLVTLAERFAHSKKWKLRQTFALLCAEFMSAEALPPEQFASEVLQHLLDLSWDPVANVRLVVARTIAQHIILNDYFSDPVNQHCDVLDTVLRRLQADKDRDVRQSAEIRQSTPTF